MCIRDRAKTLPMAKKIPLKAQYEESELKEKKITDMTREELKKLNKYSDEEIADILGDVEGAGEYKLQTGKSVRSKTFAKGKHGAESSAKRISRYIKKAGHEDMSKVKDVKKPTIVPKDKDEEDKKTAAIAGKMDPQVAPKDKNLSISDRVNIYKKTGQLVNQQGKNVGFRTPVNTTAKVDTKAIVPSARIKDDPVPVSYTHLTLPTILRV